MFKLPDLGYEFGALEPHIDATTMQIHHDLHHGTYVKNLNDLLSTSPDLQNLEITELIKNLDKVNPDIKQKVINNAGGHYNHSLFWELMSPKKSSLKGELETAINSSFGSFEIFKEKFTETSLARFGSGWNWLVVDAGKLSIESTANQDNPLMSGKNIVLGLDVWEHAYYLKYQNRRKEYIDAWWNVVNWDKAQEIFSKSSL